MMLKIDRKNRGILSAIFICIMTIISLSLNAQSDKKFIRQGNKEYEKNNYQDSEVSYRKAIDKNNQSPDAVFNIGDALYKQKKYEDAGKQFIDNTNMNADNEKKSNGLYNLANSLLMSNKVEESINAYKGSLKLNPDNLQAKYNLAYAQDLLKQQQQEQQNKDNQDQNKDKKEDKDKNQDQQKKDDQDKKDQNKNQDNQNQQQQPQQQQQTMSKEDAQRLLNALANDEKNVQEKVKLAKAAKAKVNTIKNW